MSSSMEEWAREARYDFLQKLRERLYAERIAVGHNLNDQAETVLMRLLRGSGPSGLAGILPCRGKSIIRPLIEIKREAIYSYLKARQLTFVTDSSNADTRFLRNKIRLELLPVLLEYQPRLIEHLGNLSALLREENEYLDEEAHHWFIKHTEKRPKGEISIPVGPFLKLSGAIRSRVTRHLLSEIGRGLRRIEYEHIQAIYKLARGQKPQSVLNLPNRLFVQKIYHNLVFGHGAGEKPGNFYYFLAGPGTYFLERVGKSISLMETDGGREAMKQDSPETVYLDADKINYPLTVRNYRAGDRFIPYGMRGHKKLKKFFIDLKIPLQERHSTPILISQEIPVWICRHRIDDRFKVTPETKKILKVTLS